MIKKLLGEDAKSCLSAFMQSWQAQDKIARIRILEIYGRSL